MNRHKRRQGNPVPATWQRARGYWQCSGCRWGIEPGDMVLRWKHERLCVTCARTLPFVGGSFICAWPEPAGARR